MTMDEWQAADDAFQEEMRVWNDSVARCRADHPGIAWADIEKACGVCPWHPPMGIGSPYRPGGLAGTMVRMAGRMTLNGILYYQGESDSWMTDPHTYAALLRAMTDEWRATLQDPLAPFINLQLPAYR